MLKVLTLLSLGLAHGFGNASQGAVHLGAAPESRNVARHRPCKPRPVCSHLVDGRIDLNALDRAQGWALARSSADPSPVLIFLKAPTFVSQIVVHLIHQGHPGAGRLLMVSLWQKASGREDLGPPTKRWKWDPERAIASGSFRVVVPVQQVAFAVAVAWEGPRDNGHGPDRSDRSTESASNASNASNISDIWISEVLVLQKTLSISQVSSLVSHDVSSLVSHDVSHDVSQVSHRATGGTAGTADAASETAGATTARALGVTLQSVNSVTHSVNTVSLDGPPRLRASTVSTVSLSELSETVEQLEHELPKNEFTTSVQMHVQNEQNEQNEIERIPPIYMFSRTVKPSKEIAMDKETEKVENVEKVFGVSGVATAHKSQIPSAFGATSSSGASTPNASEFEKPGGRPEDPHFLSPWPGRRSELGMPLKTCLGALLAAVLLVLKFNKFAIFQCCKGIRANDLEYNYDRLPISREDAETWWERPEHGRESQESETREIRETCETCETCETREAREAREVCREVCRTGTAGTAGTAVVRDEQRNDGNDARANSRRPSATSATSCQAAASASSAASSASGSSQAQQRSLSPTLSVSDRTISEPEREPHDEPHSEPSISDPLSTLPSTTVSEAEDETDSNHSKFLLERSERCDTRPSDSEHMMLLYASPLCFRDGRGMIPLPQIPVEKEWETVLGAYNEAAHILARTSSSSPGVSISAQTLTAGSLQRAITTWHPGVLHLSSHGVKNCLVLEDGGGTAHFFSCSMLRGMLELAGSSTRLVLLNCCSLSSMGYEFVAAGVPHVVCCSCDLKDSASTVFVRNFYGFLFQGFSVQRSFNEAVVALRSHSEGQLQAASQHFRLLPETQGHEEVLFLPKAMDYDSDSSEGRLRWRRRPRRAKTCPQVQPSSCWRALPSLPEDFLGRKLDVWSVLQQLNQRRAVVVCGAVGEDFGIGKSAILDSVHRHFTLLGHSCVAVPLRSLSQVSWAGDWIEKANAAIRLAIRECRGARMAGASSRRRRLQGPLRTGFHPLSDPSTAACLLDDLIDDCIVLQDLCDARFEWTSSGHRILLLLDECDHLVQQQQFQDALACILQRCSSYSVVLSTHQPMVPAGASKFKVVQHRLQGLVPRDAARLLLRRAQRPLRWGEIQRSEDPSSLVILNKENETEVLEAVSSQPRVAALRGNPRRLIELANDLDSLNTVLT